VFPKGYFYPCRVLFKHRILAEPAFAIAMRANHRHISELATRHNEIRKIAAACKSERTDFLDATAMGRLGAIPTAVILGGVDILDNRRIYTDGRDWHTDTVPTSMGYSIGRWIDEESNGHYEVLEVD
jgi:hypothetical protein